MRILFASVLLLAASASAQTAPASTANSGQPVASAQGASAPASSTSDMNDPTAMAAATGAPPAFVPGLASAPTQRPLGPVRISGGVIAGQVVSKVNPVYPPDAKKAGIQGPVVLAAVIGKNGNVESLRAISGPPALAPAAIEAVKQWTYQPYLLNGQPTKVETTITVNFQLNPPPPPPEKQQ